MSHTVLTQLPHSNDTAITNTASGAMEPDPPRQHFPPQHDWMSTSTGGALGIKDEESVTRPTLARHLPSIKDYLRGSDPRISWAEAMIKTTPPRAGSRLLGGGGQPIYAACAREARQARLMVTGPFADEDLGACAIPASSAPRRCCSTIWSTARANTWWSISTPE